MNPALTDVIACGAVLSVAHGTLVDQVVDSTLLENYAVSARNDTDDSVLLYAPLSLVYDYAGGTPTAFQSKIPFTNLDGRMGDSHQAVRAVWLVTMLTDVCKPRDEGFTGEWCTADARDHWYADQSRVVQTYNEEFNLAGVSVQEDLGLDMAVVFEDPQIDPDPQYDDPLWGFSHGLQGTFLAARDSDGDGVRDVKVSDLANRFDASLNGCPAPDPASSTYPYVYRENNYSDWGLPCNALKVLNYQYDYADGVHDFMQRQAQQVFADYFNSPPPSTTPSYVNLLFTREMNSRMVSYGDNAVTCSTAECTYNFEDQDLVTQAVLNWAPYKWDGSAWSSFPLEDYLDVLESNLRVLDSYKPADESLDAKYIVDGQIYMARFYFEGLYRGVSQLVALNGNPVINIPQELRDDFIYDSFYIANGRAQIATKVVTTVVEMFLKGMDLTAAWVDIFLGATKMERVIGFFKHSARG